MFGALHLIVDWYFRRSRNCSEVFDFSFTSM